MTRSLAFSRQLLQLASIERPTGATRPSLSTWKPSLLVPVHE
jgi:hypothetical protein